MNLVFLQTAHVGTAALGCPAEQSSAVAYGGTDCVARALLPAKARGSASGGGFVDRTWRLGLSREALINSARTAVATVASLLLARSLKLPKFYWAPISTIVILLSPSIR
jgi:hypothetical protein